jgi:hypothetical protein
MTCARGARSSKYTRVDQAVQTFVDADSTNRSHLHVTRGVCPCAGFAGAFVAFGRRRYKPRIRFRVT